MEDSFNVNDIRSQAQKVSYISSEKVTEIGFFMRFAEFTPQGTNSVGLVAVIIDKLGNVHYRDPKSIRFIFSE